MFLTVRYPVKNLVFVDHPWPLRLGNKTLVLATEEDGRLKSAAIRLTGVPLSEAPRIEHKPESTIKTHIIGGYGAYSLLAERDLRSWQALLASYALIDLDFDTPSFEFEAETDEEKGKIAISKFSSTMGAQRNRGREEFAIIGRAFLAIDRGYDLIEVMAHFRDGQKARAAGRSIDAYNNFYLFFETQYCDGKFKTDAAVNALMHSSEFLSALSKAVDEVKGRKDFDKSHLKSMIDCFDTDREKLVREIVELRGRLRHHSLGNPRRWKPDNQEEYEREAAFLGIVAFAVAFPKTTGVTWETTFAEEFVRQAKEMHQTIDVQVILTIRTDDSIREVQLKMNFPQRHPNVHLAQAVLEKALAEFNQRSPGAQLFGIRAYILPKGVELLRYDVGSSLSR